MGHRRRSREFALQMLFQVDLTDSAPHEVFPQFWSQHAEEPEHVAFAERLVLGVVAERARFDRMIQEAAEHWRVERMAVVDRNVLRMALYELLHDRETPRAVVIDEAIEIAGRFGGADSGAFVNGILDAVRRRLEQSLVLPPAGARELPS
jgi:N utilization substance protein B